MQAHRASRNFCQEVHTLHRLQQRSPADQQGTDGQTPADYDWRMKMSDRIYVRDDLEHAWFFEDGRIRCVLAELDPDPENENGYPCDSLEDGIKLLNEYGYITGIEYNDEVDSEVEYFTKSESAA